MSIASGISLLIPYCHRNLLLGAHQDTITQFGYLTRSLYGRIPADNFTVHSLSYRYTKNLDATI
jgi:hypothetical protein